MEIIPSFEPDIVILDLKLPDGDGLELLKIFKSKKEQPIVIILTNYANAYYKNESIKNGADYFINKLTESEKVLNIIKEIALNKEHDRV